MIWLLATGLLGVAGETARAAEPDTAASSETAATAELEFFEQRIRPVLHEHCYECHSSEAKIVHGGLLVDSREGLLRGGDSGPAVLPGSAQESLLLEAMRHESFEMPPDNRLSDAVLADFTRWIERGAADPRQPGAPPPSAGLDPQAAQDHWAFQPLNAPEVPAPSDRAWSRNPIDAFVLEGLEQQGWQPAPMADKYTLLRRATFDLTGLPPTPDEIAAFLADEAPDNFARVIDRLLASPHYGERWGRHWLDLVRYADTNGADENHKMPHAWRYRDWVVSAVNRDLPLDRFITQQLAGDLLPAPADDEQAAGELLAATGMLVVGPKMLAEQDKEKMLIDIVDEQIDTVTRTMLGMTIACARCHDHKFDPVSAEDYYALAGIFASTRTMADQAFVSNWMERPLPSRSIDAQRAEHQGKIDAARAERDRLVAAANEALLAQEEVSELPANPEEHYPQETRQAIAAAGESLKALEEAMPEYDKVMAVEEGEPTDLAVHLRGNHLRPAEEKTPRGVPQRLTDVAPLKEIPADRSGRLELAQWLTSPDHPLTGRVMANRLWMWHFGQPLMRAPSNFGLQSERPEQAELLDWLARRLIDDGWSLKRMHRLVMLSNTYQMSSRSTAYAEQDPENDRLWRQHRRRLEVEPLRDAILCAGDGLQRQFGGPSTAADAPRRTVYLPINRAALLEMFSIFDYVETANHIEQRPVTTVPHQALFLMNNPLVHQQAERLADQLIADEAEEAARIDALWLRLHGRPPHPAERQRALEYLDQAAQHAEGARDEAQRRRAAWSSLGRALIAGSGFSYVD